MAWINLWNLTEAPVGWARYMEGNAYFKLGQLDSARVCFQDAIRDRQALDMAKLNLGVIAFRQKDYSAAQRLYEESLREKSDNDDAWNNLGILREERGDTAGAIQAYKKALSLRPSASSDPRHNLAGVYFRKGVSALKNREDSLAAAFLDSCVALTPTATAYYDLALANVRLFKTSSAFSCLERALALDPNFLPAQELREKLRGGGIISRGGVVTP